MSSFNLSNLSRFAQILRYIYYEFLKYKLCFNFFTINIFFFLALLSSARAQSTDESRLAGNMSLQIGDTIPEELWNENFIILDKTTSRLKSIKLKQYRGKKMILDFWSLTCPACIESFQILDSIQKVNTEDLIILPITYEKKKTVINGFINNKILKKHGMSSIIDNTSLKKYFNHIYVPFFVWVDDRGVLLAASGKEQINTKTITNFLTSDTLDFLSRTDGISFSSTRILSDKIKATRYGQEIMPHIPRIGFVRSSIIELPNGDKKVFGLNQTVLELYLFVYQLPYIFPRSQIIAKIPTLDRLQDAGFEKYASDWKIKNTYSMEGVFPPGTPDSVCLKKMRATLDAYFGFESKVIQDSIVCLALTGVNLLNNKQAPGSVELKSFIGHINRQIGGSSLPLINESEYDGLIYLAAPYNYGWSVEELWKNAVRNNLQILVKRKKMPLLILNQKLRDL